MGAFGISISNDRFLFVSDFDIRISDFIEGAVAGKFLIL
jgi:hypothetical protein